MRPRRASHWQTALGPARIAGLVGLVVCVLAAGRTSLADGKFIPPVAFPANVTIPDQRALICFSNGVERLVIETRFNSPATNLAWVVPLPAKPVIEEATTGLFPTLQFLFRPEIVYRAKAGYWLPLFFGGLAFLGMTFRKSGRLTISDMLACLVVAAASGQWVGNPLASAVVLWPFLLGIMHALRSGRAYLAVVIFLAGLVLVVGLLLPFLATGKSKAGSTESSPGVDIIDRQIVGAFDLTTVASGDPQALQTWLATNGFAAPTNLLPVIEDYVKQGWVFVGAKVRGDGVAATNSVHPLSFTFPTPRAVYPMRLTGVGAEGLSLELYVFGQSRAKAPGFNVERCARLGYPDPRRPRKHREYESNIPVLHPGLRAWANGAPVGTKLTAALTGEALRQDVWLDWVGFHERHSVFYTNEVVLDVVFSRIAWPVALIALVGAASWRWAPSSFTRRDLFALSGGLALVVLGAVGLWANLPRTEVRLARWASSATFYVGYGLFFELEDLPPADRNSLEAARRAIRAYLAAVKLPDYMATNPFQGVLIHEEDSPGNYSLRPGPDGIEVYWHDRYGGENRVPQ